MEPTKREITKNGKQKWEVDFGLDESGVRRRPYFSTESEADNVIDNYKRDLKKSGEFMARMTAPERKQVVSVLEEIKGERVTVRQVWEDWKRRKKDNAQTVTPTAYGDAVAEFKRRKLAAGKTERYVCNTCDVLMKFGQGRERQPIHEISASELEAWIGSHRDWSLSSRRTYTLLFSSLWSVAISKGWASLNITERLEPIGKIPVDVKIYPNNTVLNILAAALSDDLTKRIIAPLALGFFGCMRPEEVASVKALRAGLPSTLLFGWHDIDLTNGLITVRKEVAKTCDQRTVRLQPCSVEWLKLARALDNPLPAINERRLVDQCCDLIGLDEWIRDGMRKCCATHLRSIYKNDYDVCKDAGNSIKVLLTHYAALHVPEATSLDYWRITPARVSDYMQTAEWQGVIRKSAPTQPKQ